jgi:hypothetical protein
MTLHFGPRMGQFAISHTALRICFAVLGKDCFALGDKRVKPNVTGNFG